MLFTLADAKGETPNAEPVNSTYFAVAHGLISFDRLKAECAWDHMCSSLIRIRPVPLKHSRPEYAEFLAYAHDLVFAFDFADLSIGFAHVDECLAWGYVFEVHG